jgi:abortive infection bacteriophage resistance protein
MNFRDTEYAASCLSRIGYYRLSAYWYPFRAYCESPPASGDWVRCDHFLENTNFDQAIEFYLFDKCLRLHMSDALERIEIAMRAILVDVLGAHGAFAHLDVRSFKKSYTELQEADDGTKMSSGLECFLDKQDEAFHRSKEEFAKHYKKSYAGPPPIWIAAGNWDWGNLSWTISMLTVTHKKEICARIDKRLNEKTLVSWMASLNEIRNACAHHSRLWNKPLTNSPSFQKRNQISEFDHLRDEKGRIKDEHAKRLYGALVAIVFLMKRIHPKTQWHRRLSKMINSQKFPSQIGMISAGFPDDWQEMSIWK